MMTSSRNSSRVLVLTAILLWPAAPWNAGAEPPAWDPGKAAQYLDWRMEVRAGKAKPLRTGQDKTACVSCHTVIPYVLARPLLRKALGQAQLTRQEAKLYDEVEQRAATYQTHELAYESKPDQSRGTEAVLNALILANRGANQPDSNLREPVRQAFEELWARQRPDGAWDWLDSALEPYESKDAAYWGASLAAIAVGMAPASDGTPSADASSHRDRLRHYLTSRYPDQNLFNQIWLLLADTYWAGLLTASQKEQLQREVFKLQAADGGWALYQLGPWRWSKTAPPFKPPGRLDAQTLTTSDGYATGLIVFALRRSGLPKSHPGLASAKQWLAANQRGDAADPRLGAFWLAQSINRGGDYTARPDTAWQKLFMADSATAFAALALLTFDQAQK